MMGYVVHLERDNARKWWTTYCASTAKRNINGRQAGDLDSWTAMPT